MSGFSANWNSVVNAKGYMVKYDATSNTYDFSNLSHGEHRISVCAVGNGAEILGSIYTSEIQIERLFAPTNFVYVDEQNANQRGIIQINDQINNAQGYSYYIDGSTTAVNVDTMNNMYSLITTQGTLISVVADANYWNSNHTTYYMSSGNSPALQFVKLKAPTFGEKPFEEKGSVQWNAPSNISSNYFTPTYEVYIDGTLYNGAAIDDTFCNIEKLKPGSHEIYVVAVGDGREYITSEPSKTISGTKLETPTILKENSGYSWNSVASATGYVMLIDGERVTEEFHVGNGTYSYTPRFTANKTYKVELYALNDGGYTTMTSNSCIINQEVKVLESPLFTVQYSADSVVKGGYVTVTITYESPNASGYIYNIGGTVTDSGTTETRVLDTTGTFDITVRAKGQSFDQNGVYYIDSKETGGSGNNKYTLRLLGQPIVKQMNTDGIFKWNSISNNMGYEYQISYDDGPFGEITTSNGTESKPIADYNSYKKITIRVRAVGNGENVITSEWFEMTWVNTSK